MPEPAGPPPADEAAGRPLSNEAPENPLLGRLEILLPDGRYLLAYSRLEPVSADA